MRNYREFHSLYDDPANQTEVAQEVPATGDGAALANGPEEAE